VTVTFGWATEPVVRLRPALADDPYATVGGVAVQVPDWTQPPMEVGFEAMVADSGSVEPLVDGRAPVDSDFTLYLDGGLDVAPADRLRIRGLVCDVQGRPFTWVGFNGTVIRASIREG
jgi:hypothetical protein